MARDHPAHRVAAEEVEDDVQRVVAVRAPTTRPDCALRARVRYTPDAGPGRAARTSVAAASTRYIVRGAQRYRCSSSNVAWTSAGDWSMNRSLCNTLSTAWRSVAPAHGAAVVWRGARGAAGDRAPPGTRRRCAVSSRVRIRTPPRPATPRSMPRRCAATSRRHELLHARVTRAAVRATVRTGLARAAVRMRSRYSAEKRRRWTVAGTSGSGSGGRAWSWGRGLPSPSGLPSPPAARPSPRPLACESSLQPSPPLH